MTILESTIVQIRLDNPELESEVRSILLSRAQEGATISEIKDDYRKNIGTTFPVYDNITEFLLSIPNVGAYCKETGTRIFYMMPSEKTKHLYTMVKEQRPTEHRHRPPPYRVAMSQQRQEEKGPYWRTNKNVLVPPHNLQKSVSSSSNWSDKYTQSSLIRSSSPQPITEHPRYPENNGYQDINNCYQDNYNYFYKRIYAPPTHSHVNSCGDDQSSNVDDNGNHVITYNNNYNREHSNNWHQYNNFNHNDQHQYRIQPRVSQIPEDDKLSKAKYIKEKYINTLKESKRSGKVSSKCNDNDSVHGSEVPNYEAHLCDFPLMGDDFFLYLARMELHCKFKKSCQVYESGLCQSGQTIRGALSRFKRSKYRDCSIIINIGSVDIMQGRSLLQIEHDFRELIASLKKFGITPILTTLAPLANYNHQNEIKVKLERFNSFIKRTAENLEVIDIWKCLVTEKGHVLFDCFQSDPRRVTGAPEPYLFWNKIGRQRVLQLIESSIEY